MEQQPHQQQEKEQKVVEEEVIDLIRSRREMWLRKYGTTVERTDLSLIDWLDHARQEEMDASI